MIDIYGQFGCGKPIHRIPKLSLLKKFYYYNIKKIQVQFPLDHLDYNKVEAESILKRTYDWKPYELKHGEAVWTRFYQGYILPERFGIDKRRAHFSNLIAANKMSREEALRLISAPIYPYPFEADKRLVLNKLQISEKELHQYLELPRRSHLEFKTEKSIKSLYRLARSVLSKRILNVSRTYEGK
ncbi:MAG: hypothetical protein Salg2KO_22710 [Salibacteraceae bacterium]